MAAEATPKVLRRSNRVRETRSMTQLRHQPQKLAFRLECFWYENSITLVKFEHDNRKRKMADMTKEVIILCYEIFSNFFYLLN